MRKQQTGSALLFVLIISFVIMLGVASIAYTSRILSIEGISIDDNLRVRAAADYYIKKHFKKNNALISGKETINGKRYEIIDLGKVNTGDNSSLNLEDMGMYMGEASISSSINFANLKVFDDNNKLNLQKKYLYATNSTNSSNLFPDLYIKHTEELTPLNIPYVNEVSFNDSEKNYRLDENTQKLDKEIGYIGSIEFDLNNTMLYFINLLGNKQAIDIPHSILSSSLNKIHSVSVGWDLKDGHWIIYIAASIEKNNGEYSIIISTTPLRTLLDEQDKAINNISNNWKEVTFPTNKNSPYKNLTWFNPAGTYTPSLLILNEDKSTNSTDMDIVSYADMEPQQLREIKNIGTFHPVAIRNKNSFTTSNIAIAALADDNPDEQYENINNINFRVYKSKATIAPVFVLYDNQYYIIEAQRDRLYKYFFLMENMSSTFESIVGSVDPILNGYGLHNLIESIIVRHGYYFVLGGNFFVFYEEGHNYDQEAFNLSNNYQILVDKSDSRIYAMPQGLECRISNNCSIKTCDDIEDPYGSGRTKLDRICFRDFVQTPLTKETNSSYPTGIFFSNDVI